MSFLAAPTPNSANRRTIAQQPVASNVLGTPWPTLWGARDLAGTVVAWTNHRFSSSGASGKGGGQVSAGDKDFRTFALGLCIGPVDRITQVLYDNQIIWEGNVSIASAATVATSTIGIGGVILTASNTGGGTRGTIAFYFGVSAQTQDPMLAQFIPNVPSYRGMCYAVFHGARPGNQGFRIGNADTLAQIAIRVEREPASPPGTPFNFTSVDSPGNTAAEAQTITIAGDVTAFTGNKNIFYALTASPSTDDAHLSVAWSVVDGIDTGGSATIQNATAFAVGSFGLMVTLTWGSNSAAVLNAGQTAQWSMLVACESANTAGANVAGMIYELLTSDVHGYNLNPAILDTAAFLSMVGNTSYIGLNYAVTEKSDARSLLMDILKNVQGALSISNGLLGPRLMGNGSDTINLTLEADDIIGLKQRPGAWYEIPQHVTIKFRDINRLFRDTTLSLPGAGDFGDDEKSVELDLPMVTDAATAKIVGTRLATLLTLPKTPDVISCSRSAFPIQFGDIIAINDPARGYSSQMPLVVLAVREHGVGDEIIELDVAPSLFGSLPITKEVVGGGGGGTLGPGLPFNAIQTQDAFELPYEFATDGSKRFTAFAARQDPDAQGFSLWASSETPPVDYDDVDADALFHAGGIIADISWPALSSPNGPPFTMDRDAYIDFSAASDDIDSWLSISDNGWFGYQMFVLIGSGDAASLYAAKELIFLGGASWRVQGLFGPLSDTLPANATVGEDIWFFPIQPLYNALAEPSWVLNTGLTFKGIPFGSRLSPSLTSALPSTATVLNRAIRARSAVNLNANGHGAVMNPTYGTDINLGWDLCNRGYGFGSETNPCEFDPAIACEVASCAIEFRVSGALIRTDTAAVRGAVSTSVVAAVSAAVFTVSSSDGLQPGDRISVVHGGGEWFGRILSIASSTITLVSPLAIVPSPSDVLNRYEAVGYVYPQATIQSDNGGTLPTSVDVRVYPVLNGLRAMNPAEITVVKI